MIVCYLCPIWPETSTYVREVNIGITRIQKKKGREGGKKEGRERGEEEEVGGREEARTFKIQSMTFQFLRNSFIKKEDFLIPFYRH